MTKVLRDSATKNILRDSVTKKICREGSTTTTTTPAPPAGCDVTCLKITLTQPKHCTYHNPACSCVDYTPAWCYGEDMPTGIFYLDITEAYYGTFDLGDSWCLAVICNSLNNKWNVAVWKVSGSDCLNNILCCDEDYGACAFYAEEIIADGMPHSQGVGEGGCGCLTSIVKARAGYSSLYYPDWGSSTEYWIGERVYDGVSCYESLQNFNTNHTPSTSPTWWSPISCGIDEGTVAIEAWDGC